MVLFDPGKVAPGVNGQTLLRIAEHAMALPGRGGSDGL